jgi:hypothetical protein
MVYPAFMDFAKAFDKVPHQRLLYKLKFYGIKNETLNWISALSFIYTRKRTGTRTVPCGTPEVTSNI